MSNYIYSTLFLPMTGGPTLETHADSRHTLPTLHELNECLKFAANISPRENREHDETWVGRSIICCRNEQGPSS